MSKLYTEEEIEIEKYECFVEGFEDGLGKHDERNGSYEYIRRMSNDNKFKKKIYDIFIKQYIDENVGSDDESDDYKDEVKSIYESYPFPINEVVD